MTKQGNKIADALAAMREGYLQRLPAELDELNRLAGQLTNNGVDPSLLDELYHRLHKLAGSGGTFGYSRLSQTASRLELVAKQWLSEGFAADVALTPEQFIAAVAALKETLSLPQPEAARANVLLPATPATEQQLHVWLVEDDVSLGHDLAQLLGQFNYDVRLFTRLDDVEAAIQCESPDVLIMDVLFPEEGANATEVLQSRPVFRTLACPVIFISALGDFESRVRAVRLGAAGFLLKPIDIPKLVDRLERIFERQHAAPYRILVVDDEATLAEHYRLVLTAAGMEAECVTRPTQVIEHLAAFHPELVLMDMHMPGYTGPELAMVIRQYDEWIGLPIVYLSAETDLDEQLRAMSYGADDFITKPISDSHLVVAVQVRASRARELSELMSKDSLTGLLKHSRIKEALQMELARAHRTKRPLSVVMADIDHFKTVNDNYGHPVGDRVIRAMAQLLKQRLRNTDIIGRYGGEEFVALLPDCDAQLAKEIIDDIRRRFAALKFRHEESNFFCTLSAGISCSADLPSFDSNELLSAADEALYHAKNSGRDLVCLADAAHSDRNTSGNQKPSQK